MGSGAGGITFGGGYLGFVGVNVQEYRGSAHDLPQTGDGAELKAAEGQELEKRGSGEGTQRSGNLDTGGLH